MRAGGPTEGNRKHHTKVAPPESFRSFLAVRVFSRPQKMVFDCVYGRRRRLRQKGQRRHEGRQHVTIPHLLGSVLRLSQALMWVSREERCVAAEWHAGCVHGLPK